MLLMTTCDDLYPPVACALLLLSSQSVLVVKVAVVAVTGSGDGDDDDVVWKSADGYTTVMVNNESWVVVVFDSSVVGDNVRGVE